MKRTRKRLQLIAGLVIAVFCCGIFGAAHAGEKELPVVQGKVTAVTLYRGQAMVTRSVPVNNPAGRVDLVVGALPARVVPDSLFAEGSKGVEVRAVRFRTRAVGEAPEAAVRKLDAEIEAARDKIAANTKMQELLKQKLAYLDKLEKFVAPTATTELSKGVLDAKALKELTTFSFDERKKAADESLKLSNEARGLTKQLSLLQRKRGELTTSAQRTVYEAVLFLEKRAAGKGEVKLKYLVGGAGWSPSYNFRATKDGKKVRVEYNAIIHQRSGESWSDVALTLSTASPALNAQTPGLAPFRVALMRRSGASPKTRGSISSKYKYLQRNLHKAQAVQQKAPNWSANLDYNWEMNRWANGGQELELGNSIDALRFVQTQPATADGPSVSYQMPGKVSVASRPDQQMARISEMKLASKFYHVATPILTSYVYREAEMTNTGVEVMLAGPVSVYLDGSFVGRAEIPSVARGQTFALGFGADSQVRVSRELVDKTDKVQGGNREQSYKYRLVIENYKYGDVPIRLFDRIPVAGRKSDIRVTLGEMADKLSEDKVYLRVERPKGILRWDVTAPARTFNDKAKKVEYGYKLEFDRNLQVGVPGSKQEEMQKEFKKMRDEMRAY